MVQQRFALDFLQITTKEKKIPRQEGDMQKCSKNLLMKDLLVHTLHFEGKEDNEVVV